MYPNLFASIFSMDSGMSCPGVDPVTREYLRASHPRELMVSIGSLTTKRGSVLYCISCVCIEVEMTTKRGSVLYCIVLVVYVPK